MMTDLQMDLKPRRKNTAGARARSIIALQAPTEWDDFIECSWPADMFESGNELPGVTECPDVHTSIAEEAEYHGVSACPAGPTNRTVPRRALRVKTSQADAFAAGHLDAILRITPEAHSGEEHSGDEFNLELELEAILDEEFANGTPDGMQLDPTELPGRAHGGLMLQIGDIAWCSICGASASDGNTSIYLRRPCDGKPANESMEWRKGRLVRRVHPTTCAKLTGSHKRLRFS